MNCIISICYVQLAPCQCWQEETVIQSCTMTVYSKLLAIFTVIGPTETPQDNAGTDQGAQVSMLKFRF